MTQSDVRHGCDVYPHVVGKALDGLDAMSTDAAPSDWMQLHIAAEVAAIDAAPEPKVQPLDVAPTYEAARGILPDLTDGERSEVVQRRLRGYADEPIAQIVALWQQLDGMTECDLAAAMVRADVRRADGFFTTLGMALEAVQSPRYVGEDAERHQRIWDSIEAQLRATG